MADKPEGDAPSPASDARYRIRIRSDLERRGVSPDHSRHVAERLAPIASGLSSDAYTAALDAAAMACGIRSEERAETQRSQLEIQEIQRLMQDFAGELRKLEEGLRILSAYALRMRSRAARDEKGTLH